jgi:hypothetical protein
LTPFPDITWMRGADSTAGQPIRASLVRVHAKIVVDYATMRE